MKQRGIWQVSTLFVGDYVSQGRAAAGAAVWKDMVKRWTPVEAVDKKTRAVSDEA